MYLPDDIEINNDLEQLETKRIRIGKVPNMYLKPPNDNQQQLQPQINAGGFFNSSNSQSEEIYQIKFNRKTKIIKMDETQYFQSEDLVNKTASYVTDTFSSIGIESSDFSIGSKYTEEQDKDKQID